MDDFEVRMERMEKLMRSLQDTQMVMDAIQSKQASVQRLQAEELDALRVRQTESERLHAQSEARFQRIETNLAEASEKLNAMISLVDQHLREHRGQQ